MIGCSVGSQEVLGLFAVLYSAKRPGTVWTPTTRVHGFSSRTTGSRLYRARDAGTVTGLGNGNDIVGVRGKSREEKELGKELGGGASVGLLRTGARAHRRGFAGTCHHQRTRRQCRPERPHRSFLRGLVPKIRILPRKSEGKVSAVHPNPLASDRQFPASHVWCAD